MSDSYGENVDNRNRQPAPPADGTVVVTTNGAAGDNPANPAVPDGDGAAATSDGAAAEATAGGSSPASAMDVDSDNPANAAEPDGDGAAATSDGAAAEATAGGSSPASTMDVDGDNAVGASGFHQTSITPLLSGPSDVDSTVNLLQSIVNKDIAKLDSGEIAELSPQTMELMSRLVS